MLRAGRPYALFDPPQRLTTQAQGHRLILLAVGGGARAIEHPVARRLDQNDVVVLAQFSQALHRALLLSQALFADGLGLEPVEVIGQVHQRVGAGVVQQLGQAGRVPAVLWRTRCQKADIFLGPETNQRLPKGISTTQQHQAHSHRVSRSGQID
ncbi:hypothetical protein D3C81_789510 [compost metagenome]